MGCVDINNRKDYTMSMCKTCTCNGQPRCPYQKQEVPIEIQKNGCAKYIKKSKPYNAVGHKTKCIQCRYLFRKKREEYKDKSFIVCGCQPSQTQRIQPISCCPNYKPLRKKQLQKRFARGMKPAFSPRRSNDGQGGIRAPYRPRGGK